MMSESTTGSLYELREKVAMSCRILSRMGLVSEITGHVSARIPGADEMFIRCRGEDERGLPFTTVEAIRRLDFNGKGPGRGEYHEPPLELPIHGEIYKARPDVGCVIHAHPPAALLCGITNTELKPLFGSFDPTAMGIALKGVPIYPRSVLIRRPELAHDMISVMGERDVCLLKGHGITVAARTVEEATILALKFERLARINWLAATSGRPVSDLPPEDIEEFTQMLKGSAPLSRGSEWVWRHYVHLVETQGATPTEHEFGI